VRLTFLGTGTSFGVPVVGCDCPACSSTDPRDHRTRHGALVETDGGSLLVDTPPELRLQLIAAGVSKVDAVWFTHIHADHVHGIDDLRVFTARRGDVDAYIASEYREKIARYFEYIFDEAVQAAPGSSIPSVKLHELEEGRPVGIVGESFTPLLVPHGPTNVYGFRVGKLGYITDGKRLPPTTLEALKGVDVLVLNALWFGRPHPSHFNIEEAIEAAREVGAERTYLTHLTHRVTHAELEERLPDGVMAAHDGLIVEVPS
jgi:phosphoribosyl 1,2-cyclic phosphate phosphodiesterase